MEIQGVTGSPYSHPTIRRKIPGPFFRPSISIGGGYKKIKRVWKDTSVLKIERGDTIAGFGVVESKVEFINTESDAPWRIRFINIMGDYQDFGGHERLFTFTGDTNE